MFNFQDMKAQQGSASVSEEVYKYCRHVPSYKDKPKLTVYTRHPVLKLCQN